MEIFQNRREMELPNATATPNHSLKRTHCGGRPKARHSILGL